VKEILDQGTVIKIENNMALVKFTPSSECAKCGACSLAVSGEMVLEAENEMGAEEGDRVEVEISSAARVLFPFVVFGIPILFFFLGLSLGSMISEAFGIIMGILFLILGFLSVRIINIFMARQKKFRSRIVKILVRRS